LKGIAKNELREHWRAADRTSTAAKLVAMVAQHNIDEGGAGEESADDRLERLRTCLHKLTERPRTLINYIYTEGLKTDDVARKLGMSGTAVRVYLHRIRIALRDCVATRGQRLVE
jgi:RNA polymerase sigma-70 factor, ECF subfamily